MVQPLAEIMTWDDEEWEKFVHDWLIVCKSNIYPWNERIGGAGDKGRDVIGFKTDPNNSDYAWDNYQCKLYSKRLSFSDVVVEFGKLIYFTMIDDYPVPDTYFFVAPYDLSTALSNLLKNSNNLREKIRKVWDQSIASKISSKKVILLDDQLNDYITGFDFSIFYSLPLSRILNDIFNTHLYFKYFNELYVVRKIPTEVPVYDPSKEAVYVSALIDVYAEHSKAIYSSFSDLPDPYNRHFNNSRNEFYFASSLEVFMREVFKEDNFRVLKSYIASSIEPLLYEDYDSSFKKCNEVLKHATLTSISHSILSNLCEVPDRKGVCHHLINDGEISWKIK
ncbi:conserved hypothetical protein [Xenorhabdus bovienii str. puntauvense]|uniref:ABC-three component systems C-terminal domain-containing protein n=1 Tax=Xenorhabdus bovienii str. puntauvense TaxID=1398201 RepID=A0A077NAK6_XENBV|nr:ABC-three component system protein [Xenorhabdus bovienii]MCG3463816.1 hypothetical protein [Xenorhabdus bovienii]CDG96044.1 conserved hypothetical protein [Xenorhabdus bovienii str. puntauvense]